MVQFCSSRGCDEYSEFMKTTRKEEERGEGRKRKERDGEVLTEKGAEEGGARPAGALNTLLRGGC